MSNPVRVYHECHVAFWTHLVDCPKDKTISLIDVVLNSELSALHCPECGGHWLPGDTYHHWQKEQPSDLQTAAPKLLDVPFEPSPMDARAALCPECNHYLSRAKVGQNHSFFIERCSNCDGIWCDRGEWDALHKMGLHASIDQIFSSDWKARIKELEYAERERQATIEKLGEDVAQRIFELAELLENHPNGDFGVAYLMRRFAKS